MATPNEIGDLYYRDYPPAAIFVWFVLEQGSS